MVRKELALGNVIPPIGAPGQIRLDSFNPGTLPAPRTPRVRERRLLRVEIALGFIFKLVAFRKRGQGHGAVTTPEARDETAF